jgi:hypothetical protein
MTQIKPSLLLPRKHRLATAITSAITAVAVISAAALTGLTGASAAIVGYDMGTAPTFALLAETTLTTNGTNTLTVIGGTHPGTTLAARTPDLSIQSHGAIERGTPAAAAASTAAGIFMNLVGGAKAEHIYFAVQAATADASGAISGIVQDDANTSVGIHHFGLEGATSGATANSGAITVFTSAFCSSVQAS